jgi:drug/metabolite transporter (DMT)-like permease
MPKSDNQPSRLAALAVMAAVTLVWSGAFAALKFGLGTLSPGAALLLRFLPVWLLSGLYLLKRRRDFAALVKARPLTVIAACVLGTAGYHMFLTFGLQGVSSATSALIVSCGALFTYIISVSVKLEKPVLRRFVGIVLALGGLYLVLRYGSGAEFDARYLGFVLLVFGAPLSWSSYTILVKKLTARQETADVNLLTAATFFIGSLPFFALIDETFFAAFSQPLTLVLLPGYLGLAASLGGYLGWNWSLKRAHPSQVAAFLTLVPVLAHLWGYLFLDETLTWMAAVGGTFVLAGITVVNLRKRKQRAVVEG